MWIWRGCVLENQCRLFSPRVAPGTSGPLLSCQCLDVWNSPRSSRPPPHQQSFNLLVSLSLSLSTNGGWRTVNLACIATSRALTPFPSVLQQNSGWTPACAFKDTDGLCHLTSYSSTVYRVGELWRHSEGGSTASMKLVPSTQCQL